MRTKDGGSADFRIFARFLQIRHIKSLKNLVKSLKIRKFAAVLCAPSTKAQKQTTGKDNVST